MTTTALLLCLAAQEIHVLESGRDGFWAGGLEGEDEHSTVGPTWGWIGRWTPKEGLVWQRRLEKDRVVLALRSTADGGCVAAGVGTEMDAAYGWYAAFDAKGRSVWTGRSGDELRAIVRVADGDFFLAGSEEGRLHVARLDASGGLRWRETGEARLIRVDAAPSKRGGLVVSGWRLRGESRWEGRLLELDAKGGEVWEHAYESDRDGSVDSVVAVEDGYVLAGADGMGRDLAGYARKVDAQGTSVWTIRLGDGVEVSRILVGAGGELHAVGKRRKTDEEGWEGFQITLTADGAITNRRSFPDRYVTAVALGEKGRVVGAGIGPQGSWIRVLE